MKKSYACDELQEKKIYKKIDRTKEIFDTFSKNLFEQLSNEPNKELALTYRALTKGDNGINGRIITPFLYVVRNNEDVSVTMGTTKGRNVHHRSPILKKNKQFLKDYRRVQYDNLSNTIIKTLEQLLPDAVKPYTHNDVLMVVSYLFNLSGEVPFAKIEKDNYDTGNDQEYIDNVIESAREHFTARENQQWFSFSMFAMCSEMICDPVMVHNVLKELENQKLLIHDQIRYPEALSRGRTKEHVIDILHLNFELENDEREECYLELQKEINQGKHVPTEFKDKGVEGIFFTEAKKNSMIDDAIKNFVPGQYDNSVHAKIQMATDNGSSNVVRNSTSQALELDGNVSEYAKRANDGLDNVIRSINAQMQQMKTASVDYVQQLSASIEKLQLRNAQLEADIIHLQAQLQSKTARLEKADKLLMDERIKHQEEMDKAKALLEDTKQACKANIERTQEDVEKYKQKYKDVKAESDATNRFLQDYLAETQSEIVDAQMFIMAQIDSLSNAKRYQLNDSKYIRDFRVKVGNRINKLVENCSNFKADDKVPNAMQ